MSFSQCHVDRDNDIQLYQNGTAKHSYSVFCMMSVLTPGGSYLLEVSSCLVPLVLLVTTKQIRLILEQHRCEPHRSTDTRIFFSKYVIHPQMQNLGYREPTVKLFKELGSEVWFPQPPYCSGITMIPDVPSSTCGHF